MQYQIVSSGGWRTSLKDRLFHRYLDGSHAVCDGHSPTTKLFYEVWGTFDIERTSAGASGWSVCSVCNAPNTGLMEI